MKINSIFCLAFTVLIISMTGCGGQQNQSDSQTVARLTQNIDTLTATVNQQASELDALTKRQDDRFTYLTNCIAKAVAYTVEATSADARYNTAIIDPQSPGYSILHTPLATILVSTKSVTPYLDGYKIKLELGNLAACDFSDFEIDSLIYNPTNDSTITITNMMTSVLRSASWTPVELILAPSTPKDIRNTQVLIKLNQIKLFPASVGQ